MPTFDPEILRQGQQATAHVLSERRAVAASIAGQSSEIAALETQLAQLVNKSGNADAITPLEKRLASLRSQRTAQQQRYQTIDETWRAAMGKFVRHLDPCDADPTVPLLLLPVRLETRYSSDGGTLRIRIFPDDIHIDHLDRGLSNDEQVAGRIYWNSIWQKPEGDPAYSIAWTALVSAAGVARAPWCVAALTPSNLGEAAPATPDFPKVTAPLGHAALARLLPDRFIAVAIQATGTSDTIGNLIAPELVTGLLADDGGKQVTVNGVPVPAGAEWLIDFDTAVAAGMGLNLLVRNREEAIEQLFVFGVRASLDPVESEAQLAALFTAHRCTRGLAFLPQGTPSNNTESDRAAWQQHPQPNPPAFDAAAAGSNAAVLSTALGLDLRAFSGLPDAERAEQPAAQAMGSALWPVTWGFFLEELIRVEKKESPLDDSSREQTRRFFRDNVRARGPIPALRVGQQPYGILPVSVLTAERWKTNPDDTFEVSLFSLVLKMREAWQYCVANVPTVAGAEDLDKALRDILGLYPVSESLGARTVLSGETTDNGAKVGGAITDGDDLGKLISRLLVEDLDNLSFTYPSIGSFSKGRPLAIALPLVDDSDVGFIDALPAHQKVASVFQALISLSWDAVDRAVKAASSTEHLPSVIGLATEFSGTLQAKAAAVSLTAPTASSAELRGIANELSAITGEAGPTVLAEHQPASPYRTSLGAIALESINPAAKEKVASQAVTAYFSAAATQAELREALELIRNTSLADRRILLCETLDLASHRLDAWLTAIVERRRSSLRAAHPSGISVGAYGWCENIARDKGHKPNGGYIHAPSLTHAVTAGVLRSAYLSHNSDSTDGGSFAIDLSSARVRTALDLMDGVREGQSLGALIGYRIERGLHENRLDRFALTLRGLAPLVARRLTDRSEPSGTQSQASIAANNVVDGLRLLALFATDPKSIQLALTNPPLDNPNITRDQWDKAVGLEDWNKFVAIMDDAAQAADAAADMILAESVHQFVQGNMNGAAASLDAVAAGDSAPPQPALVRTPAPGVPFSHRLAIAVPVDFSSGATGWSTARPRSQAEPHLEQWAQSRLGSASDIMIFSAPGAPPVSLAQASLCALDIIYDSGNRAQLEQRIRAAVPDLPAGKPLLIDNIVTFAASLRALLANAQPSQPSDFVRPGEIIARSFSGVEMSSALARCAAALAQLTAFRDQLTSAIEVFNDANPATAVELRTDFESIASFGLVTPIVDGEQLLAVAKMAAAEASERIDKATAALSTSAGLAQLSAASQALFGDGFWILPALSPPVNTDLLISALGPDAPCPPPPRAEVRRFIRDNASVRSAPARFSEVLLLADTLGRSIHLRVAQLADAGASGSARWIGGILDSAKPTPDTTVASIIFDAPQSLDPAAAFICLTIDGWSDVVPVREQRGESEGSSIDQRRVSGIALNAATASARPPQAMLLAVSPDGQRWTAATLLATLTDTLALAKIRPVTLEITPGYGRVLPAIYENSHSLQGERVLDLSTVLRSTDLALKYVKA